MSEMGKSNVPNPMVNVRYYSLLPPEMEGLEGLPYLELRGNENWRELGAGGRSYREWWR
jgi:hypothetical protein